MTAEYRHTPVMVAECQSALALKPGQIYCDCTLGGAGHAVAFAPDLAPGGLIIGIDQDDSSLAEAPLRIQETQLTLHYRILKGNFRDLDTLLLTAGVTGVDGFLFDLGVSSPQLDQPSRGFSYAQEAPLDMRMDPGTQTLTAAEIINTFTAADLTRILSTYGEERWAARIAARIVQRRTHAPLATTTELSDLIKESIPAAGRRTGGNPAKRSFQALRIAVNEELAALEHGLEAALRWLNPGGRIAVLSYHSLEDRLVKNCFAQAHRACVCPPEQPLCTCNNTPILTHISKKPVLPSARECGINPRSASAKLRWGIKAA